MLHIPTSIVYTRLATRANNKILRAPSPCISSSEEILPRVTRRTLAQLRTNRSPFLKSTLKHIHRHYVPSITSAHTTYIISSTAATYTPHCHPWICLQTPLGWWSCWPEQRKSWLVDQKRDDRTPPINKGQGIR